MIENRLFNIPRTDISIDESFRDFAVEFFLRRREGIPDGLYGQRLLAYLTIEQLKAYQDFQTSSFTKASCLPKPLSCFGSLIVNEKRIKKPWQMEYKKGGMIVIPKNTVLGKLHFLPFGYYQHDRELETLVLGLEDMIDLIENFDARTAKGNVIPQYLWGVTNRRMTEIAKRKLGFEEIKYDESVDDEIRSNKIEEDSIAIALPVSVLVGRKDDFIEQRNVLGDFLLKQKGIDLRHARELAVLGFFQNFVRTFDLTGVLEE